MDPQAHATAALRFLTLAEVFIFDQDPLARSEMLWCAAAHAMKAIATIQRPRWRNRSHDDLYRVASRVANLLNEPAVEADFRVASRLHRNMYEGFLGRRAFVNSERRVRRLVIRLANRIPTQQ